MAKKEKKEKKEKKRLFRREVDPILANAPYGGSDLLKSLLARLLIVLCIITIGVMVYTIHYFRYVEKKNLRMAQATADEAAAELAAASRGTIWFTMSDGSYMSGGKNTRSPLTQMQPSGGGGTEAPEAAQTPAAQEPQTPPAQQSEVPAQ